MRALIWSLLLVSAAVGLALLMRFNHGNVAILWPPYRVDFSVNLAVLILLGVFLLLHLLLVGLGKALDLPGVVRRYQELRRRETAIAALRDSLLALFEGRFGRAERLAGDARTSEDLAGVAALIGARAAHRMREPERRERWLALAGDEGAAAHAKATTEAELALEDQDTARALQALDRLQARGVRHIHALRLALRAHEQSGQWERLLPVLRQLERRDALHPTAIRGLRVRAVRGLLADASDVTLLRQSWASLKGVERDLPEVREAAAVAFAQAGDVQTARGLAESVLDESLSPRMLRVYVALEGVSNLERLQRAERWRERHGDDAELTCALGRLCMAESLWGKARDYLSRSLASRESLAAHLAFAELAEQVEAPDEAARHWRAAARLRGARSVD